MKAKIPIRATQGADVSLDIPAMHADGALEQGAFGTYAAVDNHGIGLFLHVRGHGTGFTLTYAYAGADRRITLWRTGEITIGPYMVPCPQCNASASALWLDTCANWLCADCYTGLSTETRRTRARKRPKWEKTQERVLDIRRLLRDYESAPRAIKRRNGMTHVDFEMLVRELEECEPRMLKEYRAYIGDLFDAAVHVVQKHEGA